MADETPTARNFIVQKIEADRAQGRWGGRVATRFPPEPNGYLHIGHAKTIVLNFGLASRYGGTCNLRFDDTNPLAEDTSFVEAILRDVRWLGYEPDAVVFASDYFEQLYAWAEHLIEKGLAYVDDQGLEEIREGRGTVTEPGIDSPFRSRTVAENLELFRQMRAGAFDDGARVLRAKIDMAHPNMLLRDPLLYRIRHAEHHRTGNDWCIYPMYDWAHGQSDAIEGITHSLCSLEFEVHRPLYDWFTEALELEAPPEQTEFARLGLTYTVMSKRFHKKLVAEGVVDGWDDPRMPTLAGLRRRGVPPEAVRAFMERVGVARANTTVDLDLFDHTVRDHLNRRAPRRLGVLEPLELVIEDGVASEAVLHDFPRDVRALDETAPEGVSWEATRSVAAGARLWIERSDFAVDPEPGFKRLTPEGTVRLRGVGIVRCVGFDEEDGEVVRVRAALAPEAKARGTIHWVDADTGVPATIRVYDRLFAVPDPGEATGDYMDDLNADSLSVHEGFVEPAALEGQRLQLERQGYVFREPTSPDSAPVFHWIVGLKDTWAAKPEAVVSRREVVDPKANAEAQAAERARVREAFLSDHEEVRERFEALVAGGVGEGDAITVLSDSVLRSLLLGAEALAPAAAVAKWIANVLVSEAESLSDLPFDGEALGRLVALVEDGTLSSKLGKRVLTAMLAGEGADPKAVAEAHGWLQVSDEAALEGVVAQVLAAHPDEVARFRAGEAKLLGFFMGQVMRASQGKANPGVAQQLLRKQLTA